MYEGMPSDLLAAIVSGHAKGTREMVELLRDTPSNHPAFNFRVGMLIGLADALAQRASELAAELKEPKA